MNQSVIVDSLHCRETFPEATHLPFDNRGRIARLSCVLDPKNTATFSAGVGGEQHLSATEGNRSRSFGIRRMELRAPQIDFTSPSSAGTSERSPPPLWLAIGAIRKGLGAWLHC